MLTASADTGSKFVGTEKGDVFKADSFVTVTGTYLPTLNSSDELDGGAGKDTLKITSDDAANPYTMADATIKNIETITIKGAAAVTADVSGSNITGLETISVLKSVNAGVHANSTTDVNVSGATGTINVSGGKNVVVNDATANQTITIGSSSTVTGVTTETDAAGTITVTDTKQGTGVINVDGGTDVTITATAAEDGSLTTTGTIKVGQTATATLPTGDIKVTQNLEFDGNNAGTNLTGGDITISGGKTVDVTVNANNVAKVATAADNIVVGTITVKGGDNTTTVTVTQNDNTETFTSAKVAEVKDTQTITFKALTAGQKVSITDGVVPAKILTFTASKDLTAEEVAAAFAGLVADDRQDNGGKVANGVYDGQFSDEWSAKSVSGATVTFEAPQANTTTLADNTSDVAPTFGTPVIGTPASVGLPSTNSVTYGQVVIDNSAKTAGATDTIKTVTVDGYADDATTSASSSITSNALTDVTLKNSDGTMTVTTTVASLNLTVDDVQNDVTLTAANLKTLNLTTTGKKSDFALSAEAVETLTITANADLDLNSSFVAVDTNTNGNLLDAVDYVPVLKTVTITGAGDVDLGDLSSVNTFTTLTASAATGDITAEVDTDVIVTTGSGNDTITVTDAAAATTTAISKAIDLGAGDDTLVLFANTTAIPTAAVNGGAGTDTISMTFTSAASYAGAEDFKNAISGFERLEINNSVTTNTAIDLAKLGFTSYVTTSGTTTGATYAGAVAAATDGDTFTFFYNGLEYTAKLGAAVDEAGFNTAITNAVITGTTTVLGTGKVTATDSTGTLVLAAVPAAGGTVTSGSYGSGVTAIPGITTKLTLNNLAANATVVLSAAGSVEAVLATATGTTDVINVIVDAENTTLNAGLFTVNNVETVKITAKGEFLDDGVTPLSTANDGIDDTGLVDIASLTLSADKAKTVTVDGYADLTLDTVSTTITKVDASAMTGDLVYTADGATAGTEVIGGAGNDTLRASGENDVLKGGAGDDTFYATDLTTVYGGAGADKFYFATPTQLSKVSTIADLGSGDTIYLIDNEKSGGAAAVDKFNAAGAQYNPNTTTTFEAKVNASLVQTGAGESTWFQHGGNTYIVIDNEASGANPLAGAVDTYTAGKDIVIEITGLVDLSTASFNATIGTLEIA